MFKRFRDFVANGIKPGAPGLPGDIGSDGPRGLQGAAGAAGAGGAGGLAGVSIKGNRGAPGVDGQKGEKGAKGEKGDHGERQGPKGAKGAAGLTGMIGPNGPPGPTGDNGPNGKTGDRGKPGIPGGNKGDDCLVPRISHGNLFSFNANGDLTTEISGHTFVPATSNKLGYPGVSSTVFVTCDNGFELKCPWVRDHNMNCNEPKGVPAGSDADKFATDMTCMSNEHWSSGIPTCVAEHRRGGN